jgi:hypothetical protein
MEMMGGDDDLLAVENLLGLGRGEELFEVLQLVLHGENIFYLLIIINGIIISRGIGN